MRKGIELPINILVVVAIAVIVLLGLVAMYFLGIGPWTRSVGIESVKNEGCRLFVNQNPPCNDASTINVNYQGSAITFQKFMNDSYNCYNVADGSFDNTCIRQRCSCP